MWRNGNVCALLARFKITEPLEKTTWKFLKVVTDLIPWDQTGASQEYGDAVNEKQPFWVAPPYTQ